MTQQSFFEVNFPKIMASIRGAFAEKCQPTGRVGGFGCYFRIPETHNQRFFVRYQMDLLNEPDGRRLSAGVCFDDDKEMSNFLYKGDHAGLLATLDDPAFLQTLWNALLHLDEAAWNHD